MLMNQTKRINLIISMIAANLLYSLQSENSLAALSIKIKSERYIDVISWHHCQVWTFSVHVIIIHFAVNFFPWGNWNVNFSCLWVKNDWLLFISSRTSFAIYRELKKQICHPWHESAKVLKNFEMCICKKEQ